MPRLRSDTFNISLYCSDQLSEMFRPFRKLLIKMRDYLKTLNKNELFQLEKLLCTNEEINLTETKTDDGASQCCDENLKQATTPVAATTTTTNVTIVPINSNECSTINRGNENFYTIKSESSKSDDDWVSEEADDEAEEDDDNSESSENGGNSIDLATADCATGYLVPNLASLVCFFDFNVYILY
jgi:hypothetical protein